MREVGLLEQMNGARHGLSGSWQRQWATASATGQPNPHCEPRGLHPADVSRPSWEHVESSGLLPAPDSCLVAPKGWDF